MRHRPNLKDAFARNLRATRIRKDFTQDQVAEAAGVSLRYLQRLEELPAKNVSLATVEKFAAALGVSSNELITTPNAKTALSSHDLDALATAVRILSSIIGARE
jgi:transcriptional regulator with XRE-family HTH domain